MLKRQNPYSALHKSRTQAKKPKVVVVNARPAPWSLNRSLAVQPERKAYDVASAATAVSDAGAFACICIPQVGADMNQRVGRKIVMSSYQIRGEIRTTLSGSATNAPTVGVSQSFTSRMIIVIDNQPNGALPATTDLLNAANVASPLNLNNRDRFRVLTDKMWFTDPYMYSTTATQSVASASRQGHVIKIFKKCQLETIFNAVNGGTIADINSGALLVFFISNAQSASPADGLSAIISTRVRYLDA